MGIVGLCSDHAGFELKEYIKTILDERGLSYKDLGTYSSDSCDYPDFAHLMGKAVEAGEVYPGIAVCGTGNGISMTLNKHRGCPCRLMLARGYRRNWHVSITARTCYQCPVVLSARKRLRKSLRYSWIHLLRGGRHQRRIDKIPL